MVLVFLIPRLVVSWLPVPNYNGYGFLLNVSEANDNTTTSDDGDS